jgi:hypothetical protein
MKVIQGLLIARVLNHLDIGHNFVADYIRLRDFSRIAAGVNFEWFRN